MDHANPKGHTKGRTIDILAFLAYNCGEMKKVLLVEDDASTAELIRTLLTASGYDPTLTLAVRF